MSWVLASGGWIVALLLLAVLRARLSLVGDAEHELRGAVTAIGLAAERMRRAGATRAFASLVALQLDRMEAALADLGRARHLRRRPSVSASARRIDVGRLSQVVANLVDNAVEHGSGPVDVRWIPTKAGTRLEIGNRNARAATGGGSRPGVLDVERRAGRGRGLAIAERAARELGGGLQVASNDDRTVVSLDLPGDERVRSHAA